MSIDCANGAVIFFFNTSHCLFPILNESSYLPRPSGLALQHVLVRAVAARGSCPRKLGAFVSCLQPLWSMHPVPSTLLASSAQGAHIKTPSGSSGPRQEEVGLGGESLPGREAVRRQ